MTVKSEAPSVVEDAATAKAKAAAETAKAQAKEAAAKLKLLKVVATRKESLPSPHAAWSIVAGANHFEGEPPEPVALAYARLLASKVVTSVDTIDAAGAPTPWTAPTLPDDDGKQH